MSLPEKTISFNEIEREIQRMCNNYGRAMLREFLSAWDCELAQKRDKSRYRHKGKRKTTIKTVLGEVEYWRTRYEIEYGIGKKSCVYLLDEAMGRSGSGYFSELLVEQIVQACCAGSYRDGSRTVSDLTGQTISHTAAWNVVQSVGSEVGRKEQLAAELAASNKGAGTLERKLLFEEQDGIILHLQGKDRKKHGKIKEMKLCIAYDGAENTTKKTGGKPRFELTNKVACSTFGGVAEFVKRKEGVIASHYNVDEIELRILGGDGADWIKRSQTDESVHYQLDKFHRNRAVLQYVPEKASRGHIFKALYSNDIDLMMHLIEVEILSADKEDERENYQKLHGYFQSNLGGLIPYHRRNLDLPKPPEGKQYRHLGAMESNIFTIIGNRMKGRRACWSIKGGDNLARLLCLKHTKKLSEALKNLSARVLPERYTQEINIPMSAAKSPESVGKGYNGFHKMSVPSSMPWLKNLAALKPLSSI